MSQIVVTKLLDGPRQAVFHIYLKSDGVTGELEDEVVIDPVADIVPNRNSEPTLTIEEIWSDLSGFVALFKFDNLVAGTPAWVVSGGAGNYIDFRTFGGIKDQSPALDGGGSLMISTTGFSDVDDQGTIIIKIRKD